MKSITASSETPSPGLKGTEPMWQKWQCPRCREQSSLFRLNSAFDDAELEVTCPSCGLRWYPENVAECAGQSVLPNEKLSCPNCSEKRIKRKEKFGICSHCGFKWDIKEFREADRLDREEAEYLEECRSGGNISGAEYEELVARSLREKHFSIVSVTRRSGDKGADILATTADGVTVVIQCKCYKGSVGQAAVQQAVAAREYYHRQGAVVITNSTFTPAAVDFAKQTNTYLLENYLTEQCKRKTRF